MQFPDRQKIVSIHQQLYLLPTLWWQYHKCDYRLGTKSMAQGDRIRSLFGIASPIVQGGMVYCSGSKLAAAVSNAGGLGLLGAGSMKPDLLREKIRAVRLVCNKPFGVNIPLLYHGVEEQIKIAVEEGIRIFFTSAGNPKTYTKLLKDQGCTVVHVTATPELAKKCEAAGVDAIVAEGFEAGGHNGRDEITTMTLIPQVVKSVTIPVIAAGGIGSGAAIAAALTLGADGVQIGSRFVATVESSAHDNFKKMITGMGPADTMLCLKRLVPVRLAKNKFYREVAQAESRCASDAELTQLLGSGRARQGMLDGDIEDGELEIGQVSAIIKDIPTVAELFKRFAVEYQETISRLAPFL
jgi:enoyl-[acyl-carrier protein] reductase II